MQSISSYNKTVQLVEKLNVKRNWRDKQSSKWNQLNSVAFNLLISKGFLVSFRRREGKRESGK